MPRAFIAEVALAGAASPANVNLHNTEKMTQGDLTNNMQALFKTGMMVIIQNRGAGAANVDLVSVASSLGRSGDEAMVIAADEIVIVGPITQQEGWRQTDGFLYLDTDSNDAWFAVIKP
jgi:hypothetical protein